MRKQMSQKSYFFALNLRNSEEVILYLLAAIMKACIFFATISTEDRECCYVSVYESGSTDATRRLLKLVQNDLTKLRIRHTIVTNGIRRDTREHRIKFLAAVRNEALRPYYANSSSWDEVIFLNDVVVCTSNIIELVDKKLLNSADVASGMDYIVRKNTVLFYDIWVNKDITGRSFQNKQPYVQDTKSWKRYTENQPFQVFTTWAGGVIISSSLFTDTGIRFRHSGLLECASCECELLVRDLWHRVGSRGLKVMVVPTVRLAYSLKEFEQVDRFLRAE